MTSDPKYLERDAKYLSPALGRASDLVIVEGSGSYITDDKGEKYLDMTSGIAVNQVGHSHPEVVQAIAEQAAKCIHTSCVVHYPANIDLATKLAELMPGDLSQTFFANSGAEAVDGSLKLCKLAKPGRTNFIVHKGSFHGRSIGGTSLTTSKSSYRRYYDPLLPGIHLVDYPNSYAHDTKAGREDFENTLGAELEDLFVRAVHPESVAAIYIEPLLGEGGYIPAPREFKNYLKYLREICDKYGILLVFDEVQSGFGRTGKWFCFEHYGVVPDIVLMAKGLSGGLPLGAFAASPELMGKMPPGSHGSTFGGNPISCRAALKLIEILERDNVMANVEARSKQIFDFFEAKFPGSNQNLYPDKRNDKIGVRGMGLMVGLEFKDAETVSKIKDFALERKVMLLGCGSHGNIIRLAPDLTISEEDTQKAIDVIAEAIESL